MITVKCLVCGKEFEAQRKSAKFCSANCRVKFNNKLGDLADKVTTADKIPISEKQLNEIDADVFDVLALKRRIKELEWVKEIEDYCSKEGILPVDLINAHKNQKSGSIAKKQGKETVFKDFTQDKSYGKPYNPFDNPIYKAKMASNKHQK